MEDSNQRATLATTAKTGTPQKSRWPPSYHHSSLCHRSQKWWKEEGGGKWDLFASVEHEYTAFIPVKPVLFYGILGLYSWAYYISIFKSILKTFFLFSTVNPSWDFLFFNSAFGINTGTGNRTRLIWHTKCQLEILKYRQKPRQTP